MNEQFDKSIMELVTHFGEYIDNNETLKSKNFGLFHKDGQLSFLDLDAFDQTAKRVKQEQEEKQEE